jgi:hypothetical protein
MPVTSEFEQLLMRHFPNAIAKTLLREKLRDTLVRDYGIDLSKILLITSFCADDIIVLSPDSSEFNGHIHKDFLGPFSMGGLAGLPYSGLTGLSAAAHHIPDDGSVMIAYGPHIGISDSGELGKLMRPGQHHESAACGALALAVSHFSSSPDYHPAINEDDLEQTTLERRLLPVREQILAAENPLRAATEAAYTVIRELVLRYVQARKADLHCEYIALVGGIFINTSHSVTLHDDYIDVRHIEVLKVAEL